jgi:4-carboxymuconolactone decarboxylase
VECWLLLARENAASPREGQVIESELFEKGLQVRREVLGAEYVDANLAETDDFMMAFQRIVTEWAWGYAWSRPGLDRKTRSMLNLGILAALGRPQELGIYVKGALASGVTVDEIREILVHATVYCGTPAGHQAFLAAHEALKAEGALTRSSENQGT